MSIYKLVTTRSTFGMPKGTLLDTIDVPKDHLIIKYMRVAGQVYSDLNIALMDDKDKMVAEVYTRKTWRSYCIYININNEVTK